MANNDFFTFYPEFSEFLPVYRDVARVWIGDGSRTGKMGMLYAEFASEEVVELGYITMYPIAQQNGYEGTDSDWARAIMHLAAADKAATVSVVYSNSTDGTVHPNEGATWTETPNPENGKYIWSKITLEWLDESTSDLYSVSYIPNNPPVSSVNSRTGDIVLRGDNVEISASDNRSIKSYVDSLVYVPDLATNADIDALFSSSTPEPSPSPAPSPEPEPDPEPESDDQQNDDPNQNSNPESEP